MAAAVHAQGKPITAAVFATPGEARRLVRQAWDEWPLDRFFPMLYQRAYGEDVPWIGDCVREGVAALAGGGVEGGPRPETPLNAGLQLRWLEPAQLAEAVAAARDGGAAGVSLFELRRLSDDHLAALRGVVG